MRVLPQQSEPRELGGAAGAPRQARVEGGDIALAKRDCSLITAGNSESLPSTDSMRIT